MILNQYHPHECALMSCSITARMLMSMREEFARMEWAATSRMYEDAVARGMIQPTKTGAESGRVSQAVVYVEPETEAIQLDQADLEVRGQR